MNNALEPTQELRFIERAVEGRILRVLQQLYAAPMPKYRRSEGEGEWRDVPLVKADAENP